MSETARQWHLTRQEEADRAEAHIDKLLTHLPHWAARAIRHLRRPHARWVRVPVAICLIPGGVLGFLPVLGFWMLPLGLVLLSVDIPIMQHWLHRAVNALARRYPAWFA
ncbi:hypothetical protein [Dongia sp.]|uniref:hypothetical protein n=1 Tax=Dongia sp. TaxID=1977262 RepID=UPI0035B3C411